MKKKVSIIVPVYNVKRYLTSCLNSVSEQTYSNIEVLVVDDGSTDGSSEICDEFGKKDLRFRIYHKENGGLSSARNFGIKRATGEYISFIDSDDFISKNMISKLVSKIHDDVDIVCCNYYLYHNKDNFDVHNISIKDPVIFSKETGISKLFYDNYYKFYAWNKIYNRKLFSDIKYPEGKLYEDITTTYRLFNKSKKIIFIPDSLYFYRIRKDSITHRCINDRSYDLISAINFIKEDTVNEKVKVNSNIYVLFFLDSLITDNKWDKKIFERYRKEVLTNFKYIIKNKDISVNRKVQLIYLALFPKLYKLNYSKYRR